MNKLSGWSWRHSTLWRAYDWQEARIAWVARLIFLILAEECLVDALEATSDLKKKPQRPTWRKAMILFNRFSMDAWFIGILRCERVDETYNWSQSKLVTSRHAEVLTQNSHQQLFYFSFLFLPLSSRRMKIKWWCSADQWHIGTHAVFENGNYSSSAREVKRFIVLNDDRHWST